MLPNVHLDSAQTPPSLPALPLVQEATILVPKSPGSRALAALRGLTTRSPAASVVAQSTTSKRRSAEVTSQKEKDIGTVGLSHPPFCIHAAGMLRLAPLLRAGKHFLVPISCTPTSVFYALSSANNNVELEPWLL